MIKRVSEQIHTRELDRSVAHYNFKRLGFRRVNAKDYYTKQSNGKIVHYPESYFSKHWREYTNFKQI